MVYKTFEERFAKYTVDEDTGCWVWNRATSGKYAVMSAGNGQAKFVYAHRASYEHFIGEIPDGYEIHHQCRNTLCVNPDHLKACTPLENKHYERKPYCKRGHEQTEENTTYSNRGWRQCRLCKNEIQRQYVLRKKKREQNEQA